ncbi:DUF2059 domain-containing protein [Sphingomonas montanisoli]|uniref:DUF2059 domain-containing protein n=1 Tax=Sphingomonas montanisoli TaxID=2606412 RepID=A0A5D9CAX9_9SPHN|nr:DUF2059 domain-containing protein [Sphingomonas montanisoli]TZG27205.1 DUF2059 domain-containing protein [Sphingomonas montanisoli]
MIRTIVMAAGMLLAAPVAAQAPAAAAAVAPVDPARLAASRALIDQIMPPAQRDAMMTSTITPMIANMRESMTKDSRLAQMVSEDPRVQPIVDRFMNRVIDEAMGSVRTSMPQMFDAMAIAYARQFTVAQLNEVNAFYATPTGRAFMAKMPQIMADPAVLEAQRATMTASMGRMPDLMKEFQAEIAGLDKTKK